MVVATPGRAPTSVPVTPAAAGEPSSRKGGRNVRLSIASSLGTIDENDHDGANTTYQDDITEDDPEEPLDDSRRSVRVAPVVCFCLSVFICLFVSIC